MPTITIRKEVTKRELRELLYDQILATGPEHFNQQRWAAINDESKGLYAAPSLDFEACGTTACLAGHAAALGAKINLGISLDNTAALASEFGLDTAAFEYVSASWPAVMRWAYEDSKRRNPNERDAEWWGALQYLISLRDRKD